MKSPTPSWKNEYNTLKIYQGDSLEILKEWPEDYFDMVFADPPYFLSNDGITCKSGEMVSVNKGIWDKSKGFQADHKFILQWLTLCKRVIKPNGTIWVSGTSHIIYSVGYAMQELGFKILNDIIWFKPNAAPNLSCKYFTHSTETLLWALPNSKGKHTFNYEKIKEINNGKQMRNLWSVPTPPKKEKLFGKHPTQKPLQLLKLVILSSTKSGDIILDPFSGSGTTGVAAIELGRKYIGIELEKDYINLSIKRLENATLLNKGHFSYART